MKVKNQLPLQRLIGKIDNDFNIDNSDWIPRVGAWVTDALSQMQCLPMERKRRELEVVDRIAQFPCTINAKDIVVKTKEGCEIVDANDFQEGCGCGTKGSNSSTGRFIGVTINDKDNYVSNTVVAKVIGPASNMNYVLTDNNQIELNFDIDCIIVETYEVATYFDEYFNCEVPYIYDNGLLLEALAWYCLFKMLSRGYKHQVYSLASGQPYLNPFQQWLSFKPKATASVKIDLRKNGKINGWNNFFYNSTFRPRD